jgi:signal transduction histidine kinase/DNA-binding NarL/FixJ family response regulator
MENFVIGYRTQIMGSNGVKPLNVLVVEDDIIDAKLLHRLLCQSALSISDVKFAECLDTALGLLDKGDFDVVFLDLGLPDSRGIDSVSAVNAKAPDVPIIVLSGLDDAEMGVTAVQKGVEDYLVKGQVDSDLLARAVRYAVERKQIRKILDRKQKHLEAIFDAIPIGMLLVDENLTVKRTNDAIRRMIHRDYLEIINLRIGNALRCINSTYNEKGCGHSPACQSCPMVKAIESAFESQQPIRKVEFQPTLKANSEEITPWLSLCVVPTEIYNQKHVVVVIDDITARKEAEKKLKETMEMKSQFVSTVSHELRTPLTCIKEGVTIVLDGVVGEINKKQKYFLDIANRNINRLAELINDVLDFQKLDAGKMKLNLHESDVRQVAEEIHETMMLPAKSKEVEFSLELDENLPKVTFDRDRVIQVLTNLVSNAIKFTPQGGQVRLSFQQQNDELVIRVSDTGMGIPKEELPKIFTRFYRVQQPGKEIKGTGLGLAIVKKIMILHGGRIEVESELDHGSTFSVFLPLTDGHPPQVLPEESDELLESHLADNKN